MQLKWSQTVNTHSRPGMNIPCDLHMEHLNHNVKSAMSSLHSNISDVYVGKCIKKLDLVVNQFDKVNGIPPRTSWHTKKSRPKDVEKIMKQLQLSQTLMIVNGRIHKSFPEFQSNVISRVDKKVLNEWME